MTGPMSETFRTIQYETWKLFRVFRHPFDNSIPNAILRVRLADVKNDAFTHFNRILRRQKNRMDPVTLGGKCCTNTQPYRDQMRSNPRLIDLSFQLCHPVTLSARPSSVHFPIHPDESHGSFLPTEFSSERSIQSG